MVLPLARELNHDTSNTMPACSIEAYVDAPQAREELARWLVIHAPYPLEEAEVTAWSESLLARAGIDRPAGPPLAHYARGVEVEVFALERLSLGP